MNYKEIILKHVRNFEFDKIQSFNFKEYKQTYSIYINATEIVVFKTKDEYFFIGDCSFNNIQFFDEYVEQMLLTVALPRVIELHRNKVIVYDNKKYLSVFNKRFGINYADIFSRYFDNYYINNILISDIVLIEIVINDNTYKIIIDDMDMVKIDKDDDVTDVIYQIISREL